MWGASIEIVARFMLQRRIMVHSRLLLAIAAALLSAACSSGTTTGLGQEPDAGTASKGDSGSTSSIVPGDAGSGSTTPTGSTSGCDIQTGSATCDGCMKQSCCTVIAACGANADCVALDTCLSKCPSGASGQACGDACYQQHTEGATKADAIDSCAAASCKTQCQ